MIDYIININLPALFCAPVKIWFSRQMQSLKKSDNSILGSSYFCDKPLS